MEKISGNDFDKLNLHGKGSSSWFYNALLKMQPGEALILRKTEWHVKYPPTTTLNKIERKFGFHFERGALADRSGWAFKRVS